MKNENILRRAGLKAATLILISLVICAVYLLLRRHGIGARDLLVTDGNPHSITVVSILAYSMVFRLEACAGTGSSGSDFDYRRRT